MKKVFFIPALLLIVCFSFFAPFFVQGKLPIPADTIIGLYHPFRDLYAKDFPRGIPYKNFLITDPVRQQYPWRALSISIEKQGELPLWNPYSMTGSPLLATMQSAVFYPLNIIFFLLPFSFGWGVLIFLQTALAGIFLYWYLVNLRLKKIASFLGAIAFSFSGFFIAWLEWGTIGHVALWLPLILLAIDKLFTSLRAERGNLRRDILLWSTTFIFSLTAAFFAGHLQTFFYLYLVSVCYFLARWFQSKHHKKLLLLFILLNSLFVLLTSIQWYPTLLLISESARGVDLNWHKEGWFIPWQHLAQFISPDFFGNPATLNYWGVWNYGEMIGYVGLVPLLFASFALFCRRDKKTLFFGLFFFVSLLFALPTYFAQLPFSLNIPFLSTAQPTRLLFITDFSLAILAALGMDYFMRLQKKRAIIYPVLFIGLLLLVLWFIVLSGVKYFPQATLENIFTAKRNLYLPTILFMSATFLLGLSLFIRKNKIRQTIFVLLLLLTIFDLFRFAQKFTPFTNQAYLFPNTKTLSYLQEQKGIFRIMTTDAQIMPPNFSTMYKLQTLDGYDPLYLQRYGELVSAVNRRAPNIQPPFGFNRIVQSINIDSPFLDLFGVKYILSFSELPKGKFTKVFTEGRTSVYENKQVFPRTFFVTKIQLADGKHQAIEKLFEKNINLRETAVVEGWKDRDKEVVFASGEAKITNYGENKVEIETSSDKEGFLVFIDTMYPTWHARICSREGLDCKETQIYRTNYNFRGIVVPAGKQHVLFYMTLL